MGLGRQREVGQGPEERWVQHTQTLRGHQSFLFCRIYATMPEFYLNLGLLLLE